MNPFKVLGIKDNDTLEAAKAAFKSLVKKFHPDVDPSPKAKEEFQKISDAYEQIKSGYKTHKSDSYSDSDWFRSSYNNDYSQQFADNETVKRMYEAYMKRPNQNPFYESKIVSVQKVMPVSLRQLQEVHTRNLVIDKFHNLNLDIPKNTTPFFKYRTNVEQNGYTFHIDFEWKITDKGYVIENHRLVKTVNISAKDFFNNDSFVVENHMGHSFEVKLKDGMSTNKLLRIPKAGITMGNQSELVDDLYVKINVIK